MTDTRSKKEQYAESVDRRTVMLAWMIKHDKHQLGFTMPVLRARLAYLFTYDHQCRNDLKKLEEAGQIKHIGERWTIIDKDN